MKQNTTKFFLNSHINRYYSQPAINCLSIDFWHSFLLLLQQILYYFDNTTGHGHALDLCSTPLVHIIVNRSLILIALIISFQTDEEEVITFLLSTEIIPLCLRIMESGSELSKTVATFILQKILLDEKGLSYICQTFERFSHVAIILVNSLAQVLFGVCFWILIFRFYHLSDSSSLQGKMVIHLAKEPSVRLLKHVVRCYLRLSDNQRFVILLFCIRVKSHLLTLEPISNMQFILTKIYSSFFCCVPTFSRACEALQQCLPDQLRDATFAACLQEDKSTKYWLTSLIKNVDTYSINPRQVGISPLAS